MGEGIIFHIGLLCKLIFIILFTPQIRNKHNDFLSNSSTTNFFFEEVGQYKATKSWLLDVCITDCVIIGVTWCAVVRHPVFYQIILETHNFLLR